MILFEKIRWKNFLSTGNQYTEFNLQDSPSTLIIGRNGAGKSTILDALCFALFNKPFRKINKPQLVNSINEKECVVEVEFSVNMFAYKVVRGIKPNTFEVYRDGRLLDQDAAAKDTQKYLEQQILKLNYKSFTQVVILGSSTFVPFMQLPASHRREVIEDLLDIGIFSNMNTVLKDRVSSLNQRKSDCDHLLKLASEKVAYQEKNIMNLQAVAEQRVDEKQKKIEENEKQIKSIQKTLADLKEEIDSKEDNQGARNEISGKIDKLKTMRAKVSQKRQTVGKELKFLMENDTCPTCRQDLSADFKQHRATELDSREIEFASAINQMSDAIDSSVEQLHEMEAKSKELAQLRSNYTTHERDIVRFEFENLDISKQIIELQTNQPNIAAEKEQLQFLEDEYSKTKSDCGALSKEYDEYRIVSNLLKDSGIKSRIIKKYIPVFNTLINKFLHSMDFYVNFTLDENFDESIKSRFRDDFSYSSFSEGEKQKIDLALLFTWREIAKMKNSVSTNLLILDEVFDSSLDDGGTQELLKILRSLGNDANLFVISHKGEILVDKFLRTAIFEKVNDFSKMRYDG